MKLPSYDIGNGQENLDFGRHAHNMPSEPPVFNPGTPSKMPTHFGPAGKRKMEKVGHEFKMGTLRSGSKHGPIVTNRKQMIAIALSEANEAEGRSRKRKK